MLRIDFASLGYILFAIFIMLIVFIAYYNIYTISKELPNVEKRCKNAGYDGVGSKPFSNEWYCYKTPIEVKIARGDYDVHS